MTALVLIALALAFVAYKAAKLAVFVVVVSLAVCVAIATGIALAFGRTVAFGLSRSAR